jgi:hypothetical protein
MTTVPKATVTGGDRHHMQNDFVSSRPKQVLIVVANSATNQLGWPVGFWAAELTHPYYELTSRGVEVTIVTSRSSRTSECIRRLEYSLPTRKKALELAHRHCRRKCFGRRWYTHRS